MLSAKPAGIQPKFVERPWGTRRLQPWFPDAPSGIGEVWFHEPESPLLVKLLFTEANLSVQVHPDDEYAKAQGHERGKTEMWHILSAWPDAQIALGLTEALTAEQLRESIRQKTLDSLLRWVPVKAGDTFLVEAGTIHAIGAGIVLCEIQQNSDITYRLHDFDRGRELHIEHSVAVSDTSRQPRASGLPVTSRYFHTEEAAAGILATDCEELLIVLSGEGSVGGRPVNGVTVWHLPANAGGVEIEFAPGARALRTRPIPQ
ncbi:MAG TPA: class I mannose-6-phosphate isomerase [Bryobacteraceae bacterium]|nr:class I mannose-6-phosphate isomerase [Bryobacteraceae bacterium]